MSQGIPLQVCDVFLAELNAVDAEGLSLDNITKFLAPFLDTMAHNSNTILNERIAEKVMLPILENNVVEDSESEEDESALNPQ